MSEKGIIVFVLAGVAGLLLILFLCSGLRKKNRRQVTIVRNGMDIKGQRTGLEKGEYFQGNKEEVVTYVIGGPDTQVWKISFQNQKTGEIYRERFNGRLYIGRGQLEKQSECLVISNDSKISKIHCIVYAVENDLFLMDMNSKNHTWVNGRKIEKPVRLENGDIIRLGDTRLRTEFGK